MFGTKLVAICVILFLITYVSIYALLHVARPIVQLYYPSFTLPGIDANHKLPKHWYEPFSNPAFLLFLGLYLTILYFGWAVVSIGMLHA